IFQMIPTFIGATMLAFLISQLVPGDFLAAKALEPNVRPETIERMRSQFGLDQPMHVQYVRWMGNLVQGNLGQSFVSNQPVTQRIAIPMRNSMYLAIFAIFLLYLVAIPMGVYSAVRQYSFGDQAVSVLSYFGLAIPNFFFAQVLILLLFTIRSFTRDVFDYNQMLLPVAGLTSGNFDSLSPFKQFLDIMWHLLLPAFVVATSGMAGFTRVLRAQMIEYLGSD